MTTRSRRIAAMSGITILLVLFTAETAHAVPGSGVVSDIFTSSADYAFKATATGFVTWVLDAVGFFVNGVVNFLKTAGRPEVEAVWFSGPSSPYAAVRSIALLLLAGFAFLGIISGLIQGDVEGMLRRIAGNLPTAIAGMVVTTVIVAKLLDLTDALSTAVLSNAGGQATQFLSGFGVAATAATAQYGFAALVLGGFAVAGAFLLWVELLVRSSLVYFLVALSPLAFAATLWPTARGVLRRLVELLVAVIVSKLVICIALAIGAAALGGAGQAAAPGAGVGDAAAMSMGTLLSGTVLLILAAWSPFLLMRMIPIVETAVVAQGISRAPARGATTAVNAASSAGSMGRLAGGSGASSALSKTSVSPSGLRIAGQQQSPQFTRQKTRTT